MRKLIFKLNSNEPSFINISEVVFIAVDGVWLKIQFKVREDYLAFKYSDKYILNQDIERIEEFINENEQE